MIFIACHSHLGLVTVIDPPTQDNDVLVQNVLADHILQTAMRQFTIPPLIRQDYKQVLQTGITNRYSDFRYIYM